MAPAATVNTNRGRLAERRKKRRMVLIVTAVLLLLCAVGGVVYSTHIPEVRISGIDVSGGQKVPHELIRTHLDAFRAHVGKGVVAKDNVFLFPRSAAAQSLLGTFPRLLHADVRVHGFLEPVLRVQIDERVAFARWCRDGDNACFLMDEQGFVFAFDAGESRVVGTDFYGSLVADDVVGRVYAPDEFAHLALLAREFEARELPIARILLNPESNSLDVVLEQGFSLKILRNAEPLQLAETLDTILTSKALRDRVAELEYVDMRFGNRMYYRFLSGERSEDIPGSAVVSDEVEQRDTGDE